MTIIKKRGCIVRNIFVIDRYDAPQRVPAAGCWERNAFQRTRSGRPQHRRVRAHVCRSFSYPRVEKPKRRAKPYAKDRVGANRHFRGGPAAPLPSPTPLSLSLSLSLFLSFFLVRINLEETPGATLGERTRSQASRRKLRLRSAEETIGRGIGRAMHHAMRRKHFETLVLKSR